MIRPGSKERVLRSAVLLGGDFLIAWAALAAIVEVRRHVPIRFTRALLPAHSFTVDAPMVLLFGGALIVSLGLSGFYHDRVTPRTRPSVIAALVIQAALVAIGSSVLVRPLPRTVLLAVPLLEMLALPLWRRLLRFVAPIRPRQTILLGTPRDVEDAHAGLRLAGDQRISVCDDSRITLDRLGDPAVRAVLRSIEEVILVSPDANAELRLELLRIRGPRGFLMLASHVDALLASRMPGWIGDQPLVEVAVGCGYGLSAVLKRAIDVVGSVLLLIATSPLSLFTALAIFLDDGGPVLIRQPRVGLGGKTYGMWKFRSMAGETEKRVTRVGSLLRRYHVDELPQLINVLAGEMSLVGPRPEQPELAARIQREVPDFDLRSMVRPGMAGLAQVAAEYNTRPEVKLRYDLMYMCDWSVWLDLRLMLRAVSSSLAGTGH